MNLFKELFSIKRYKKNQGLNIRRFTMIAIWIIFVAGAYKFSQMALDGIPLLNAQEVRYFVALLITLTGMWFGYRLVHWSVFADFLISVESEMLKVSWPGKPELQSSTIVVLVFFALLSVIIYLFDLVWVFIFNTFGILG